MFGALYAGASSSAQTTIGGFSHYFLLAHHNASFIDTEQNVIQKFLAKIVQVIDQIYERSQNDPVRTRSLLALFSKRIYCVMSNLLAKTEQGSSIARDINLVNTSIYSTALLFKQQVLSGAQDSFDNCDIRTYYSKI